MAGRSTGDDARAKTTLRPSELRGLWWRELDFLDESVTIRESKTDAGVRVIPPNRDAMTAIRELWNGRRLSGVMIPTTTSSHRVKVSERLIRRDLL